MATFPPSGLRRNARLRCHAVGLCDFLPVSVVNFLTQSVQSVSQSVTECAPRRAALGIFAGCDTDDWDGDAFPPVCAEMPGWCVILCLQQIRTKVFLRKSGERDFYVSLVETDRSAW